MGIPTVNQRAGRKPAFLLHYLLLLSHTKHWPISAVITGVFKMTDLSKYTSAELTKTERDNLRVEVDQLQNKLRVSEEEVAAERNRANSALKKTQKITEGIFTLLEPEILHAFTSMIEESIETITNTGAFERAVESQIEYAFDNSSFLNADDVDERIGDAIGDIDWTGDQITSSFDTAVRDAVREMINDGDISISVENIELSVDM